MAVAGDVPDKFDVVINGQGYVYAPSDAGLPPSVFGVKTEFGYTPTFITRQNTQGDYGDNQQDFWLTFSQRDWSLGEQQRYFKANDDNSKRLYWTGSKVDVSKPGQVSIRDDTLTLTAAAAIKSLCDDQAGCFYCTTTNLYQVQPGGTGTDNGAHGLGVAPSLWGMIDDNTNVYMSSTAGGTVGVRKWAGAFATFSATGADTISFVNNTLYGFVNSTNKLIKYDTAGVASDVFQWKGATGAASTPLQARLAAFGGKLLILLTQGPSNRSELWQYDGAGVSVLAQFPSNFDAYDMDILAGTVFIGGRHLLGGASTRYQPAVYYYANGTFGRLWVSDTTTTTSVYSAVSDFGTDLIFNDDIAGKLMAYNIDRGGVHSLGAFTVAGDSPRIGSSWYSVLHSRNQTASYIFPGTSVATTATIQTSLGDFDSSLTKLFRGIRVEFDSATDGNGGSVDIAYRVGDVDGAYTTLQTGAVSGTEYTLSGVTGRSISVKVTLNKGTSTSGPVLKRISVRAAPQQTQFRQGQYVLYLGGKRKRDPMEGQLQQLRDGSINPKDGKDQIADLVVAATSVTPISITDPVNGTMTSCLVDLSSTKFTVAGGRTNEFIALVSWREV